MGGFAAAVIADSSRSFPSASLRTGCMTGDGFVAGGGVFFEKSRFLISPY